MPYKDKDIHRLYRQRRYQENLAWLRNYKVEQGCKDCGYNAHHAGLEFDHLRDKIVTVSAIAGRSPKAMMLEIEKCEVVCGTCHNIRTFERK